MSDDVICLSYDYEKKLKELTQIVNTRDNSKQKTITESIKPEPKPKKKTYGQDWHSYNLSQTKEKYMALKILSEV